jgi:predicted nucleic acid-binding protein
MAAVDSSTLIAFIQGDRGPDVELFEASLATADIVLPPVVVSEVLSEPQLPARHRAAILALPMLELSAGYWLRAAETRAILLRRNLRARLPDALIAQACIDNDVVLINRDSDFRHFARYCGLKLA